MKSKISSSKELKIAFGNHANDPSLENIETTLDELSGSLDNVETDLEEYPDEYKQQGYIVRGQAEFAKKYTTGKGRKLKNIYPRADKYINSAELLVADIDDTDISPFKIHRRLKKLNIAHIIYTSFSHTKKAPRYRIVIPCLLPSKDFLKPTVAKLQEDIGIEIDGCSNTWNQRWYYGYAKHPKQFRHYHYLEGEPYTAVSSHTSTEGEAITSEDTPERKENRKTMGKNKHFYKQSRSLAQGYANEEKNKILGNTTTNEEVFEIILERLRKDARDNGCDLDSYKHIENIHTHIWGAINKVKKENKKKKTKTTTATNIFELFEDMTVTDKMVAKIESIKPLYEDVIAKGHIVGFIGLPNSGKTSLMRFFCEALAKKYSVVYVNMDVGPDEIKFQQEHASKYNYKLIAPNFTNMSNKKVLEKIESISNCGMDLSETVMIIDSTKKLVKVNQKDTASDFLEVLRSANSKGVTIILLMHTTKYRDAEGNLIHAGTQDFIDDIDETNFIESVQKGDTQYIAIYPDKLRNTFVKKTSYTYNRKERTITKDKTFNDLKKVNVAGKKVRPNDNKHILSIIDVIQNGTIVKGKICNLVNGHNPEHSVKHTRELLDIMSNENYTGYCLIEEEGCANNATEYTLKDDFELKVYKKLLALKVK